MAEPDPILIDDRHAVVEPDFLGTRGSFATELPGVPSIFVGRFGPWHLTENAEPSPDRMHRP